MNETERFEAPACDISPAAHACRKCGHGTAAEMLLSLEHRIRYRKYVFIISHPNSVTLAATPDLKTSFMIRNQPTWLHGRSSLSFWFRRIQLFIVNAGVVVLAYLLVAAAFPIAVATQASESVNVNPLSGNDLEGCGAAASPCRTISFAVQNVNTSISSLRLSEGIFHESTVIITGMHLLVISGVLSFTVFDCSHRLQTAGAAFRISNSNVVFSGISFQNCSNPNSTGGALSCSNSSIVVSQCSFTNCSAASGGAISVVGPGDGLFLLVKDSSFAGNSAIGGSVGCPHTQMQPCSSWGDGIAAFEIFNVTISSCRMVANFAQAFVPRTSSQHFASRNAVAGGGCVSVLYFGNASRSSVLMSDNTFEGCEVDVSTSSGNLQIGNGMFDFFDFKRRFRALSFNRCAGYGGAVSVYFGLYAGRHLLNVSLFDFVLLRNVFTRCVVIINSIGGNAYGGGVSVYIGGYFSSLVTNGTSPSAADIGDTIVSNLSMTIHAAQFSSCMSNRSEDKMFGGNVYGGSFSFYTGPYVWSRNTAGSSKSTCGVMNVNSVTVSISDSPSHNCIAVATSRRMSYGASTYGGSLSAMHIGGYSWSWSGDELADFVSSSSCGALNVNNIRVSIRDSPCFNCGAILTAGTGSFDRAIRKDSFGASSFGGSISAVHIGAYVWSFSKHVLSDSMNAATSVSGVHVHITNVSCINSSATTTIRTGESYAAIARSGSINTVHIGAYSWSYSGERSRGSSSTCGATNAHGLFVNVSNVPCVNCSAVITAGFLDRLSYGAISSAGSLSAVHIGAYSWSYNGHSGRSSSTCEETSSNFVNVSVAFASCFECCAVTNITGLASRGANSNGGSIGAVHIGAYSWSWTQGGLFQSISKSFCNFNNVRNLAVFISRSAIARSMAIISMCQRSRL